MTQERSLKACQSSSLQGPREHIHISFERRPCFGPTRASYVLDFGPTLRMFHSAPNVSRAGDRLARCKRLDGPELHLHLHAAKASDLAASPEGACRIEGALRGEAAALAASLRGGGHAKYSVR